MQFTPRSNNKTSMKRQRQEIGWTTALLVCVATLQSSVDYGDAFLPTARHATLQKTSHVSVTRSYARRKAEPWDLAGESDKVQTKRLPGPGETRALQPKEPGYKFIMDHKLLTMDEEYELGIKIRKYIDTKEKIEEIVNAKHFDQRLKEIERRRGKEAQRKKAEKKKKKASSPKSAEVLFFEQASENYNDDLSMEEEFMMIKGRDTRSSDRSRVRKSIEEMYGYYDDDDDEEDMMEQLGMAIYGVDSYEEEEEEENLDFEDSPQYSYGSDQDEEYSTINDSSAGSTQLFGTLESIRLLTEREIKEDLEIEGGRSELSKIMIDGAIAKQELIKSNTRLVKSIAQKWMGTSKGSGLSNRQSDQVRNIRRQGGDWTTPAMDEVIQQGVYGLSLAAERFQPDKKFKFSTYATYYITNEVRKVFQSATTQCLYVPPYFYIIRSKYEKIVRENYRNTMGNQEKMSIKTIARMLELKPERLEFILRSTQPLVQLDASPGNPATQAGKAGGNDVVDNNVPLLNTLASTDPTPEQIVETSLLRQCIENALAVELLPLERDVVRLRHGLDDGKSRTVKEVMQCTGGMLTIGDVRNLEQRAYKKLRFKHSVHAARLREFAEEYMDMSPELLEVY